MARYLIEVPDGVERALLVAYLERRREDLAKLRQALHEGDMRGARLIGHRLYGSGSAYGLPRVSVLGHEIERAAQARDGRNLEAAIDRLAEAVAEVVIEESA